MVYGYGSVFAKKSTTDFINKVFVFLETNYSLGIGSSSFCSW